MFPCAPYLCCLYNQAVVPLKQLKILLYLKVVNHSPSECLFSKGHCCCPFLKILSSVIFQCVPAPSALVRFLSAYCLDLKCCIQIPKAQRSSTLFPY